MHAFIIRPFGKKDGIDFDRVEIELIRPALIKLNYSGGTTGEIIKQGNIRSDMFEQLLAADLVIADISIHNANVYYELGIRHAFREKCTFLIRSKGDDVPFDLKTDRYMAYDAGHPGASLLDLIEALKETVDSPDQDSPVFQLLPGLKPSDPAKFMAVPLDFREEVDLAAAERQVSRLEMLSAEVDGLVWKTNGLRLIGNAQFRCKDWKGGKATWETVRRYNDMDLEANTNLGTIYQRLGDLERSNQAIERALQSPGISKKDRAEIWALMARNVKTTWEGDWKEIKALETKQRIALTSPNLERSHELYNRGFAEDRNHYYSSLNALAMAAIRVELAIAQPDAWDQLHDSKEESRSKLKQLKLLCSDLAVGVRMAIESVQEALARGGESDIWTEISSADLKFLSSKESKSVGRAYRNALAVAPEFARDSARKQILLYRSLGIFKENTIEVLETIPAGKQKKKEPEVTPKVILFTGHRIDAVDRDPPRFPRDKEDKAKTLIAETVTKLKAETKGPILGISGGASGGDILFHEVCEELGIPSKMYLVIPKNDYIKASVADSGPDWIKRFKRLCEREPPIILCESSEMPRWLKSKRGYSIWARSNMWMLYDALVISDENLTLISLYDGGPGDGPGGTKDMFIRAKDRGATLEPINYQRLFD